jgi:cytochrome c oxidase subunit I+III
LLSGVLLAISVAGLVVADRTLPKPGYGSVLSPLAALIGTCALAGAVLVEVWGQWQAGLTPTLSSYGAMVYLAAFLDLQVAVAVVVMALLCLGRSICRRLDRERRNSFDYLRLLTHYGAAQTLFGLILVHGFPRLMG